MIILSCELYSNAFWLALLIWYICILLALLKQQGVGVKGMTKGAPVNEEVPPLLEGGGKMEV